LTVTSSGSPDTVTDDEVETGSAFDDDVTTLDVAACADDKSDDVINFCDAM